MYNVYTHMCIKIYVCVYIYMQHNESKLLVVVHLGCCWNCGFFLIFLLSYIYSFSKKTMHLFYNNKIIIIVVKVYKIFKYNSKWNSSLGH